MGHPRRVDARDRAELAEFLRARRERLRPSDVGLPDGGRRRTPGLRRQEVAQLAAISIDYYIRLEQGRGANPSKPVLAALARALLLTADERDHLYRVAGEVPPRTAGPARRVPAGILHLVRGMAFPAYVLDAKYDLLAWNELTTLFLGRPEPGFNVLRSIFTGPDRHPRWSSPEEEAFVRGAVADLRAATARYPADPGIRELVAELLGTSPGFGRLWEEHAVAVRRSIAKRIVHDELGPLEVDVQYLHVAETDQRLVVYTAPEDSPTAAVFRARVRHHVTIGSPVP
jgi:transcriptional regulator with XRE-family HTH domain